MESRQCYEQDRMLSEKSTDGKTCLYLLDLQRVRVLPEIAGVKSAVFMQRIWAYNESLSPIDKRKEKSIAMLWHQGVAGRNNEDIASCFENFILHEVDCDTKHLVLWMDNCGPQNKNWTLYPALVAMVNNSCTSLETITLKYFEAGHIYMSADSFHYLVEKEAKKMYNLYDFQDFLKCVSNVGRAVNINAEDFHKWEKQLSEGKNSKATRPLLQKVIEV